MWLSHPARRTAAAVVLGSTLLLGSACGGGDSTGSTEQAESPSDSASPSPSVPAEVVGQFRSADAEQAAAFAAAEGSIRQARAANDYRAAQGGGRQARAALYAFDADLREISFPAEVQPAANEVVTAIGEAVAAFDQQNQATDESTFLAGDQQTGPTVLAFRDAVATLREELGLPAAAPTGSAGPAPEYVSPQRPITAAYLEGETVTDANAWRDDLLQAGEANAKAANTYEATRSESFGIVEAWVAGFPLLKSSGVVGSAVPAPKNGVSGFTVLALDDKEPASASNPTVLAFAAKDTSGVCAFGVLYGAEVPDRGKILDAPKGAPCTGNAARAAAVRTGLR